MHKGRSSPVSDESGSLTLVIASLFLLTLLLSFAIIDISGAYLAKRELINLGEAAITRAAHNVDDSRYYAGERTQVGTGAKGPIYLLPIDCSQAARSLDDEVAGMALSHEPISVVSFRCDGDQLWVTFSSKVKPILSLPLIEGSVMNSLLTVTADLNASNVIE